MSSPLPGTHEWLFHQRPTFHPIFPTFHSRPTHLAHLPFCFHFIVPTFHCSAKVPVSSSMHVAGFCLCTLESIRANQWQSSLCFERGPQVSISETTPFRGVSRDDEPWETFNRGRSYRCRPPWPWFAATFRPWNTRGGEEGRGSRVK